MAQLNQLPDEVDIAFVAGDTFRIRLRVIDPATTTPLPLELYAFCAQIAKDPDRSIVSEFAIAPDPDAPDLAVILTLTPTETASLPSLGTGTEFKGMWDLEVVFPSGDVRTVAKGSVLCYLDISHCQTDG